jgi:hypothetical protein
LLITNIMSPAAVTAHPCAVCPLASVAAAVGCDRLPSSFTVYADIAFWLNTNAVAPVGSVVIDVGSPQLDAGDAAQVDGMSFVISVRSPLARSREYELKLNSDWLTTYKSALRRPCPLPQLISSELPATSATSAPTTPIFFNIHSPQLDRIIGPSGHLKSKPGSAQFRLSDHPMA